jgi:hypothetical protein
MKPEISQQIFENSQMQVVWKSLQLKRSCSTRREKLTGRLTDRWTDYTSKSIFAILRTLPNTSLWTRQWTFFFHKTQGICGVDEGLLICKSRGSHYGIEFTVCLDVTPYNLVQITNILKERATFIFYLEIHPRSSERSVSPCRLTFRNILFQLVSKESLSSTELHFSGNQM